MSIQQIKKRIAALRANVDDYGYAHAAEDALYAQFVAHVANGGKDLRRKAALLLTTKDLHFRRHCD
jgi:hypothetical protein